MRQIYIFSTLLLAVLTANLSAQCSAGNGTQFSDCLTSGSTTINVSGTFTVNGNVDLSGKTINLGSGNNEITFTGTVTVSSTTVFSGGGNVKVVNGGNSACGNSGQCIITVATLNSRIASGGYTTLADALSGILPVELSAFKALPGTSGIELRWSTASELNNARFLIERSGSDGYFRSIGEAKGAGTTSTPQDYQFTDRAPLPGSNYYRLRQEDYDGKFEYSQVIAVQSRESSTEAMKVAPNPVDGRQIRLEMPSAEMPVRIELMDAAGKRTSLVFSAMERAMEADLPQNLSAGMYYLTAVFADRVLVSPIVVR